MNKGILPSLDAGDSAGDGASLADSESSLFIERPRMSSIMKLLERSVVDLVIAPVYTNAETGVTKSSVAHPYDTRVTTTCDGLDGLLNQ